jgi:uncharacterized membrane protein
MKKLTNYFLKGLLIFVPTVLTIFTVIWIFTKLDSLFGQIFKIEIPGLGLVITISIITLTGLLASNFLGNKFFALIDNILTKVPLLKLLYSAIKDMTEALTGEKKSFVTDHVAVYLPQSYNFAGSVLIFPAEQVKPLNIESSEAMAFIVSGGVSGK